MLDTIQILLTVIITILTVLLTIIGIAIFQILREFKGSLKRINKILDDTGRISESVAAPMEEASDFLLGLRKGVSFLRNISRFIKEDDKSKRVKQSDGEDEEEKKRFFTKSGRPLAPPSPS